MSYSMYSVEELARLRYDDAAMLELGRRVAEEGGSVTDLEEEVSYLEGELQDALYKINSREEEADELGEKMLRLLCIVEKCPRLDTMHFDEFDMDEVNNVVGELKVELLEIVGPKKLPDGLVDKITIKEGV